MNTISFPALGIKFNIDPIAIHYKNGGGIYWYGIIIGIGILLAVLYSRNLAAKENENKDLILDLIIFALPISVLFARTYYVIFSWESYKDNLLDIFKIWEGGIAIYGAIIGAVLTAWVFFKKKKVNVLKMFDICTFGLLIGQMIGRWGNFVNAEAYGGACSFPWGMSINGQETVHPTFLYESLWNFMGFLILSRFHKKRPFYGFTFFSYLVWYGIGRFFIEGMRTDSLYIGSIRVSQLIGLACAIGGVITILVKMRKKTLH